MMLAVRDLHSGYGDLTIVRGATFEAGTGEIIALLGHNGVGKTTLLRTIIGLLRPERGEIAIGGANVVGLRPHRIAALGVAYVPQEAALFADLSVADNLRVAFGGRREFDAACDRALEGFAFLRERFRQRAGTLSGGEQKMLLVARALLVTPRFILADEVTEGVQPMQVARIAEVLRDINARDGTTMVLVEQHLDFALELAGRYLIMKQGRIAASGNVAAGDARPAIEDQLAL